jgi:hypothetical protein
MKKASDFSEQPIQIVAGELLMPEIKINVNDQLDCVTYQLDPFSRVWVRNQAKFPKPVDSVYVSYDSGTEPPWKEAAHRQHIAEMLTGLSAEQLTELGKVTFVDPKTKRVLFDGAKEPVETSHDC